MRASAYRNSRTVYDHRYIMGVNALQFKRNDGALARRIANDAQRVDRTQTLMGICLQLSLMQRNALSADGVHIVQRGTQPDYSDQVEVVERWHKVDDVTLQSDVWVFDPVNLAEPWYTRQSWTELANDDAFLRIRYWDCRENQNNDIIVRDDGTSQFPDFDFVADDAAVSDDASVKAAASAN